MKVPLFDLTRQYAELRQEMLDGFDTVLSEGNVVLGKQVKVLESAIAQSFGWGYGIGVANGSDALLIAVAAMGVEEGDYVITTPYTFFATASCITRNGGIPFFVDIDPVSFNIDLDQVEAVLEHHPLRGKIKGIIPVHLFGQAMDLDRLDRLRKTFGVWIIEDCAQSIGACWPSDDGLIRIAGSVGELSTLSFFPTKNLGAYGDGGMILTDRDDLDAFCRSYRVHGSPVRYVHERIGINSRLDELQAMVLNIKWKYLQTMTERRRAIARGYAYCFEKAGLQVKYPEVPEDMRHVFHQYVIRLKGATRARRDGLRDFLQQQGIGTSIYYPMGLHQQQCFQGIPFPEMDLSQTLLACDQTLALPIFPEMTDEEVDYVVEQIKAFFESTENDQDYLDQPDIP